MVWLYWISLIDCNWDLVNSLSRHTPPPLPRFSTLVIKVLIVFVPFRRSYTWPRQTCSLLPPRHSCRSYRRTWCPSRTTHRHSYRQSSIVWTARTQVTQTPGVPSLPQGWKTLCTCSTDKSNLTQKLPL